MFLRCAADFVQGHIFLHDNTQSFLTTIITKDILHLFCGKEREILVLANCENDSFYL